MCNFKLVHSIIMYVLRDVGIGTVCPHAVQLNSV